MADPDGRVPSSLLLRFWEYLPTRRPDESFGFWLAEQLRAPPLSLATWVMSSSPTLGQGFERALRYERLLHDEARSELELRRVEGVLELRARRADLLRTHGAPPPCLIALLHDALNEHSDAIDDTWLHLGFVIGKPGQEAPSEGWQLHAGLEMRPHLVARGRAPSWLPKLLDFPGEC